MYLTPEAVDDTLAFVTNNSPDGSSIIFTYSRKSRLSQDKLKGVSRIEHKFLEIIGEPQIFGIADGNIKEFLSNRGFALQENLPGEALINRYIKARFWKGRASRGSIAHAVVASDK